MRSRLQLHLLPNRSQNRSPVAREPELPVQLMLGAAAAAQAFVVESATIPAVMVGADSTVAACLSREAAAVRVQMTSSTVFGTIRQDYSSRFAPAVSEAFAVPAGCSRRFQFVPLCSNSLQLP